MKKTNKKYYLAYGSNLNLPQMRVRCPGAKIIGTAEIEDYELLSKGGKRGSYLTIEKRKNSKVPVAVWEVTAENEKALDRYEGFPSFYYKKDFDVTLKDFRAREPIPVKAFAYIMHEERPFGIPSGFYMDTCLAGYRLFGFDPEILLYAYAYCKEVTLNEKRAAN